MVAELVFKSDLEKSFFLQRRHGGSAGLGGYAEGVKYSSVGRFAVIGNISDDTLDLVSIDIKQAYLDLGEITGSTSSEEIIDAIFSKFCLGK